MHRGCGVEGVGVTDSGVELFNIHDNAEQRIGVAKYVPCNEDVSCSLVNMGCKLLGFAIAKSLFPPLW